jgi:hypothetical protein
MKITKYDSGKGNCAVCGKPTLHTHAVNETVRVRCCKKCEKRMPAEFFKGILIINERRKTSVE